MKPKRKRPVLPIYSFAIVWFIYAMIFQMYTLPHFIVAFVLSLCAALGVAALCRKLSPPPPEPEKPEPEPEPEKASAYGPEVDAILEENRRAQLEMGRLYASIKNAEIKKKVRNIMEVADKIARDAIDDPNDVPQIRKFQNYYLPTTIKLLNAYDRMGAQGIEGQNISGTMKSIEEMLDTATTAYRKQLDSLFANQAMDIETDIQVMNTLLKRQGLTDSQEF